LSQSTPKNGAFAPLIKLIVWVGLWYKYFSMEKMNFKNDIKVFGVEVKTFPNGVDDAFHQLIKTINDKNEQDRYYYGISEFKNGKMFYYATAEEKQAGEAEKFNYETFIIESGNYIVEKLENWRTQTDCIKDIFQKIMNDGNADTTKPAVEWYKNDKEMLCMIKAK
jgi:predicted transcriptional regulator YdeE